MLTAVTYTLKNLVKLTHFLQKVIRGHHIYKDVRTPVIGEELICQYELGNLRDPFALSLVKGTTIVGHVPRKISTICSMFLRQVIPLTVLCD